MPTISHFYGITIVMYLRYKEHNPPHIHAITQDFDAPFSIDTGEIMDGFFPPKAKAMVKGICSEVSERALSDMGDGRVQKASAFGLTVRRMQDVP